jgi:hypothetical protein
MNTTVIAQFTRAYDSDDDDNVYDQVDDYLRKNDELQKIDCIAIYTGYTDRIISSKKRLKNIMPAVIFTDKFWNKDLHPKVFDQSIYEMVKPVISDGAVAFKANEVMKVFEYIDILNNADYCEFCNSNNLYRLEWYKNNDKVILVAHVDTESG